MHIEMKIPVAKFFYKKELNKNTLNYPAQTGIQEVSI